MRLLLTLAALVILAQVAIAIVLAATGHGMLGVLLLVLNVAVAGAASLMGRRAARRQPPAPQYVERERVGF